MFRMGDWHDSLVVLAASTKQSQAGKPKRNEQGVGKVSDKESFPNSEKKTDFSFRLTENDNLLRCSLSQLTYN
jgi:hypothetical protein